MTPECILIAQIFLTTILGIAALVLVEKNRRHILTPYMSVEVKKTTDTSSELAKVEITILIVNAPARITNFTLASKVSGTINNPTRKELVTFFQHRMVALNFPDPTNTLRATGNAFNEPLILDKGAEKIIFNSNTIPLKWANAQLGSMLGCMSLEIEFESMSGQKQPTYKHDPLF